MRIKISTKLIAGFTLVILLMVTLSLYITSISQHSLRQSVGNSSTFLAEEMLKRIDNSIYFDIEKLQILSNNTLVKQTLSASNREFQKLDDINEYIRHEDGKWISVPKDQITPFMQDLINNALSNKLRRELIQFHVKKYGYSVFEEIFITNKFGANIAQTRKTTDYQQDDEAWWQTTASIGHYVGDVAYDESTDSYGITVGIRIDDEKGITLGILKAILSIKEVIREVEIYLKKYESTSTILLTRDGFLLYRTSPYKFLEKLPNKYLMNILHRSGMQNEKGYFTAEDGGIDRLFSYAHSKGYREFAGLGWIIVVAHDEAELLKPAFILRNTTLAASLILILLSIIIALFISRTITKPLAKLSKSAETIGKGDLDHRIESSSKDEIGELAAAFNRMTESRQKAEMELRESESKFRDLFDLSPQPVALTNVETGRFIDVNEKFCELTQYTKDELIGKQTTKILVSEEDRKKYLDPLQEFGGVQGLEIDQKIKDGSILNTLIFNRFVQIAGKKYILTIWTNITDKRQLENQLQQALKMESIGRLAGGIAHDFNNILGIILGNTELALDDVQEWNPARHNLNEIRTACLRARDIVRQILAFSRQSKQEKKPVKIDQILEESIYLLRSSIPTTIDIRLNISSQVGTVNADPTQINQIILNLCTNAAYAMREKGGMLEVDLENIELNEESASRYHGLTPGKYVQITVRDTGNGIDPKVMDQIFDPYFTTKGVGEGSGMGLAVVHGIVKNHGGDISVHSEMGKGTAFLILLPSIIAGVETPLEESSQLAMGNERILLVDDESALIETFQPMLERLGYQVTSKTSSMDALEAFRAKPDDFDIVITDMTMPQMTGADLAKGLMRIRSDIPIILCTGYSEMIDKDKAKEMGISAFVMKPMVISKIAKTIREVLVQGKEL